MAPKRVPEKDVAPCSRIISAALLPLHCKTDVTCAVGRRLATASIDKSTTYQGKNEDGTRGKTLLDSAMDLGLVDAEPN